MKPLLLKVSVSTIWVNICGEKGLGLFITHCFHSHLWLPPSCTCFVQKACKQFTQCGPWFLRYPLTLSNIILICSFFPSYSGFLLLPSPSTLHYISFLHYPPTCPLSPVSNDNMHPLFITHYYTSSVALHYINYSFWKSDHHPASESITAQFPLNNHRCR